MATRPTRAGPYRLLDQLGHGGMGVVYRAEHVETGAVAAVKTIRALEGPLLSSFRREVGALSRIHHPGVVRIYEHGVDGGVPWMAMELVEGESLRERIIASRNGPGLDDALRILQRLCTALAVVHGEGIVHRDLKPQNVIVRPDGSPVLIDFGVVGRFAGLANREAADLGEEGAGTIAYMAPEQIQGEPVDARADLYAFGCILYEAIVGIPPFGMIPAADVAWGHLQRSPVAPSEIVEAASPELDAIVLRLLAKPPARRFGYAVDVAAALGRLLGIPLPEGEPVARPYLNRPAFAGREAAMSTLRSVIRRLDSDAGGLALVCAESGAGKTRLAIECAREATAVGYTVIAGECARGTSDDGGDAVPLGAFRPILTAMGDACRTGGPGEDERLFGAHLPLLALYEPSLAGLVTTGSVVADLRPDDARRRLFAAVADALRAFARRRPFTLVLDDLQWADELSIEAIAYAVTSGVLTSSPIAVIGTIRTDTPSAALDRLGALEGVEVLDLGRLGTTEVAAMVGDMLAIQPPPVVFSRYLARHSSGNPFFVAEYLRASVEDGIIWRDHSGEWQMGDRAPLTSTHDVLPMPETIRDLLGLRFSRLGADALSVVRAASVLGRESESWQLDGMVLVTDEAVDELLRRNILEEPAAGVLRFTHDQLRKEAYRSIDDEERRRLHVAAADAFESLDLGEEAHAIIAGHRERAGDRERARAKWLSAARWSMRQYATADAERMYRSAVALAPDPPDELAVRTRIELGFEALRMLGRIAEAREVLLQAPVEAQALGLPSLEAEALRDLGVLAWERGEEDVAVDWFERSASVALAAGDLVSEGITAGSLGNVRLMQGRFDEALALYLRSAAAHESIGDVRGLGAKLGNAAIVYGYRGDFEKALEFYERAILLARECGHRSDEGRTLGNLALMYEEWERYELAERYFAEGLEILREIGNRREEGIALANLSALVATLGRYEEGITYAREAYAIHTEVENHPFAAFVLGTEGACLRKLGRLDEAEQILNESIERLSGHGHERGTAMVSFELGMLALDRGRDAQPYLEAIESFVSRNELAPDSHAGKQAAVLRAAIEAAGRNRARY